MVIWLLVREKVRGDLGLILGVGNGDDSNSEVRSSSITSDTHPLPSSLVPDLLDDCFMTRITDFGRKRTHVEATFNYNEADPEDCDVRSSSVGVADDESATVVTGAEGVEITGDGPDADGRPPKKKRKRGPRKKARAKVEAGTDENGEGGEKGEGEVKGLSGGLDQKGSKKRKAKSRTIQGSSSLHTPRSTFQPRPDRKEASEKRRRRRMAERNVNTICFACREKGHAVQDCPKIADGSIKPPEKKSGFGANQVVGICYRCGSRKHRLSACREKVSDPSNPLPFASCFVCNGNGHLASRCPENKQKGVYPNGGSCKLCGETDHLARNCKLRDKGRDAAFDLIAHLNLCGVNSAVSGKTTFLGTGAEAGADEDDFHTFKRKSVQVEKEQRTAERVEKSGLGNQAQSQQKKKVVKF